MSNKITITLNITGDELVRLHKFLDKNIIELNRMTEHDSIAIVEKVVDILETEIIKRA